MLSDAVAISDVRPFTAATFVPRGGTPLYDAMGHTIADATIRAERLRSEHREAENILFVTFTDGQENQSREYDRAKLFKLVKKREASGWTFAYLGANQDSYAEGGAIGYSPGSTQNFAPDGAGSTAAFASLATSVSRRRGQIRRGEHYDNADLFEGDKAAEMDLQERGNRSTR